MRDMKHLPNKKHDETEKLKTRIRNMTLAITALSILIIAALVMALSNFML